MRILAALGDEPRVTEEKRAEPSLDFAWGPVPDSGENGGGALLAHEWGRSWPDQAVAALNFRTRGRPPPGVTRWTCSA